MLRSLVALPGRSSPFSLTRRGQDAYSRTDTRLIFSSSGLPPAKFGSSSLAFLTVDWMLRRRIACPTCRADRAASPTDPSEKGKWIPGVPHRHRVGSAPYPYLLRASRARSARTLQTTQPCGRQAGERTADGGGCPRTQAWPHPERTHIAGHPSRVGTHTLLPAPLPVWRRTGLGQPLSWGR